MKVLRILLLSAAIAELSCGGGGGGGGTSESNTPLQAPSGVAVHVIDPFFQWELDWNPSPGAIDGYNLEGRIDQDDFSQINDTLISPEANGVYLNFSTYPLELTEYSFRVNAVRGQETSPYSNITSHKTPLYAPRLSSLYRADLDDMIVSWVQDSKITQTVELERAVTDVQGNPTGGWALLASLPSTATRYVDSNLVDGTTYTYRIKNIHESTSSEYAVCGPQSVTGPLRPTNLVVAPTEFGFDLSWQNRSQTATELLVRRVTGHTDPAQGQVIASLPKTATHFIDASVPIGFYTYAIVASDGTTQNTSLPVSAVKNPAGSMALTSQMISNRRWFHANALRPQGTWVFGTYPEIGVQSNNDPWPAVSPADAARWANRILTDSDGYPHFLYSDELYSSNPGTLIHAWFDGTSWQYEPLGIMKYNTFGFRLDVQGTPHALVDCSTNGEIPIDTLRYYHKTGRGWEAVPFDSAKSLVPSGFGSRLALDAAGHPHVLLNNWNSIVECTLNDDDTWSPTTLPTGPITGGFYQTMEGVWIDDANAWVFFQRRGAEGEGDLLMAVQKLNGVWQAPVPLGTHTVASGTKTALSPDHSRVAIICDGTEGTRVYLHANNTWSTTWISPEHPVTNIDFDGDNRMHVLVEKTLLPTASDYFVEFRED